MNGGTSREIEYIQTLIGIWTAEYKAITDKTPGSSEMTAFETTLNTNIYKLTETIIQKIGGSDDTARYYRDNMYKILCILVKSTVMGTVLTVEEINILIKRISSEYGMKKLFTLLEKAEIPIFSAILGIMRTTSSVCNNVEEFNSIVNILSNNNNSIPKISVMGCSVLNGATSYGSKIMTTATGIFESGKNTITNLSKKPNNTPQTTGGSRYFKKYKKKIQKIKKYNKTKKYKKRISYLKKTKRI